MRKVRTTVAFSEPVHAYLMNQPRDMAETLEALVNNDRDYGPIAKRLQTRIETLERLLDRTVQVLNTVIENEKGKEVS
jgi:hypothetical protein